MTQGKARFGKKRVVGCKCDYNFTCRPCLEHAAVILPVVFVPPRKPA